MKKSSISKKICFSNIKKSWWLISIILILIISCSLLELVNPIIYKNIIDEIIPSKHTKSLIVALVLMVFFPWTVVLLSSLKNYILSILSTRFTESLRNVCFDKCMHSKQENLETTPSSQFANRIMKECGKIGEVFLTNDLASFASQLITLISILITMLMFNFKLTLVCCIAFPISFLMSKFVASRNKSIDKQLLDHMEKGLNYLSNVIRKIKTIKLKNGFFAEHRRWQIWLDEYKNVKKRASVVHNINRFLLSDLIVNMIYGILFFVAGIMVIKDQMTIGELVLFISFIPKVYSSLRNVLNIKVSTAVISNSFEKIDEVLELEQERIDGMQLKKINSVHLSNIDFSYSRGDFHLSNFDLDIQIGEKIGIVGTSGGGKSTIFELITSLYTPQNGCILINGENASSYSISSIRSRIAVVTQNVELFNDSILNNLIYPLNESDSKKLSDVIKIVQLDKLISRLPEGLNTIVGEDGDLFSGGEKQRISIANALIHDSDIILLDEFTSALDTSTEKELIENIIKIPDKAVVMISHRIYNIMMCDKVVVMENGKIVESGCPRELLKNKDSKFSILYSNIVY